MFSNLMLSKHRCTR